MIDLRENRKILEHVCQQIGHTDIDEYVENEPFIYTQKEMEEVYLENSNCPDKLIGYLNINQMLEDDKAAGFLATVEINGQKYWARLIYPKGEMVC